MKKIMDRVYNVEKSRKRAAVDSVDNTPKKRGRPKKVINLASRYPSIQPHGNDTAQQQIHTQAILKEMDKEKPRKDILLPLMKTTFHARRQYILESEDSVLTKLEKFPALKMPSLVGCMYVHVSCDEISQSVPSEIYSYSTKDNRHLIYNQRQSLPIFFPWFHSK